MQRSCINVAYWLAPLGFLSLVSYATQGHLPKGGTVPVGRALPHQSLVKKMSYGLVYRKSGGGIFSIKVLYPKYV